MQNIKNNELQAIIKKLAEIPEVIAIYLFGSQVNGRAREDSDIDIGVIMNNPSENSEYEVYGIGNDDYDITPLHKLPIAIQFRAIKEGKLLFCKNKVYLEELKIRILRNYLDFSSFISRHYRRIYENV